LTAPRKVRVVAALIADPTEPGRYLIQQRLPGKSRPLLWEFPGGKVEPVETDQQALARECREELDVELEVGERIWDNSHAYADLAVELVLYRGWIRSGEPKPLHAHALRWATGEEMRLLAFCEADLPLVELLARGAA
jgi:8-oxo-dGTP diphosphatase